MTAGEAADAGLMSAVAVLSRAATGTFTRSDLLRRLVDVAARHLPVDGAGVMIHDDAQLSFVHGSTTEVSRVEELQELMQQGPCQEAVQLLREVVVPDLHAAGQPAEWQSYRDGAEHVGLRSVVAVPLLSRGRGWGVLDLYRSRPGPWTRQDLAAARLLADVAVSYVVMAADRDAALAAQRELAHRSLHDQLTGLPNRALLADRLELALSAAARHGHRVAVLFIDLDRFKQVNDTFGHAGGDRALVHAAERMSAALRKEDTLARLAGDEFVVICPQLPPLPDGDLDKQVRLVAGRLQTALAEPLRIGAVELTMSASIGIALAGPGATADGLLSEADAAMYTAKQRRHGELVLREHAREQSQRPGLRRARQLERELARALPEGQLRVHYQPIVAADDLQVHAVEALLRWQHPVHGLLPAIDFIDLAEGTGLIAPIGRWLIDAVCGQLRNWQDRSGLERTPAAYVNLSRRELTDPTLPATLRAALERHRLQPQQLGLEVVEASVVDPHLVDVLAHLHDLGHPLSVDDFGTGYSSLSRLIQLPVSTAKIDKSIAAVVGHDPRSRALVEAVLVVAAKLDLQVVGEGVEDAEQAESLRDAGCPLLQGFFFGAPQPADSLRALGTG